MSWFDKAKDKLKDAKRLGSELISRPHSPAPPKPEHGAGSSGRRKVEAVESPSVDACEALGASNSTTQDADHVVEESPKSLERRPKCKFVQTKNPQHDIAVLYVAFALDKSPSLKELILEVVELSSNPSLKEEDVKPCIQFTTQLILALDVEEVGRRVEVEEAIAMFQKTIKDVISKDSSRTREYLHRITDSIEEIKVAHPDISEKKRSSRFSESASGVLGVALPILDIIKEGSSMIPVPMVQPLIGVVAGFLKAADQAFSNFESMRSLAAAAAEYIVTIAVHCPQEMEERWTRSINKLQETLSEIVLQAEEFSNRHGFLRFLQQDRDKGDITKIKENLEQAIKAFYLGIGLNIKHDLDTVSRKIDFVLLTHLPPLPSHNNSVYEYFGTSRETEIESTLEWIADATDDEKAAKWITGTNGKRFLWIHGAAGVGKSTLAQQLLVRLKDKTMLASYAYFATGLDTDPKMLVQMMARELCSLHPGCRSAVVDGIQKCQGVNQSLVEYITHYLVNPITSLAYNGPLVIILDALDEWSYRQEFLDALFKVDLQPTLSVKFIITSRHSNDILSVVDGVACIGQLNPVSDTVCRAYFAKRFKLMNWDGQELESDKFNELVKLADGLLIWAATVCSILLRPSSKKSRNQIVKEIINSPRDLRNTKMKDLYRMALERLFPDDDDDDKESRSNICLSMVALKEDLPSKDFARLLAVGLEFVEDTCSKMTALQTRGAFDKNMVQPAIKLFHASFLDYLGHDTARHVMVDNCIRFFKTVARPDAADPHPFPFRKAQLYVYMGKHCMDHMKEGQSEVTGEQLRLWVALSLSRLLFLADENDYQPSPQALQSLSVALVSPQGMSYSPEILLQDLFAAEAVITGFLRCLIYWEIDYSNPDFYKHKPEYIRRWAPVLNGLAIGLHQIQTLTSDPTDDTAISVLENLITAYPPDHWELPTFLNNLGYALHSRSELNHSYNDLDRAVLLHTKALDLHPKDSRNYAISLLNLGHALHSRFRHFGRDPKYIKQAIDYHRRALRLFQLSDFLQPSSLYALGNSLIQAHSLARENPDYLEEAISLFCAATQFFPRSAYDLRLYVARKDSLVGVFGTVAQHMQRPGSASRRVQLVELDQDPHIQIDFEEGRIVFKILDPLLTCIPPLHPPSDMVDDVYLVIQIVAYFRSLQVDDVQISSVGFSKLLHLIYIDPDLITTRRSVSSNRRLNPHGSRHQAQYQNNDRIIGTYPRRPHMFALIIGIENYQHPEVRKVKRAVSSALAIANYLENDLGVNKSNILMLLDANATRHAIINALQHLKLDENIKMGDVILIYYIGCGTEVSTLGRKAEREENPIRCILPYDFDQVNTRGIPARLFVHLIEDIRRKKGDNITVILDCNHSGYRYGSSSHILLAACSEKEDTYDIGGQYTRLLLNALRAAPQMTYVQLLDRLHAAEEDTYDIGGQSQLTRSLLDALRAAPLDQMTYVQLLDRLQNITGQNPQLVGNNRHRIVFSGITRPPFQIHRSFTLHLDQYERYILDAGAADGVCPGAEFTVYADHVGLLRPPNFGVVAADKVQAFQTVMRPLSGRGPSLDKDKAAFACQTRASALEQLNVFISPAEPLVSAFDAMLMQMKTLGHDCHRIALVDNPSVAHLAIERENDETAFVILDKRLTAHGITKYAHKAKAEDMMPVLLGAAHYYYHLNRSYLTCKDIEEGIQVEFFKLKSSDQVDEDTLLLSSHPCGENLLKDGIITLSICDEVQDEFSIRITNTSTMDLYPSIFYFNNRALSITQYFGSGGPSQFEVDSPLQKNGGTLNWNLDHDHGYNFLIPDGLDVNVGFLKCFFPTSPVDLSDIATSSIDLSHITTLSVDLSDITTSSVDPPVDLFKTIQNATLESESAFGRVSDGAWSCAVIPVVQRRVKEQWRRKYGPWTSERSAR